MSPTQNSGFGPGGGGLLEGGPSAAPVGGGVVGGRREGVRQGGHSSRRLNAGSAAAHGGDREQGQARGVAHSETRSSLPQESESWSRGPRPGDPALLCLQRA